MWFGILVTIGVLSTLFLVARWYYNRKRGWWKKQGIPEFDSSTISPLWKRMALITTFLEFDQKVYERIGTEKYAGFTDFGVPTLYVKDLDLVKQILVKDFDHFVDRPNVKLSKADELVSKMLVNKAGKEWKDLRSIMSPAFTTGKIRRMFEHFNECANELAKYLKQHAISNEGMVDFQDAFGRFTLQAIASIVFGVQGDSFQGEKSTFKKMAKQMQSLSLVRIIKFFLYAIAPPLARLLRLSLTEKESTGFFASIIERAMKERRENPDSRRNDFLQMMLEAQEGQLKLDEKEILDDYEKDAMLSTEASKKDSKVVLDDVTVLSQALLFFTAGFDTIESVLTFAAYELALNQDVQDRLAEEVTPIMDDSDGNLTYDGIQQLPYLEMVVSETLRHHPPAFALARLCTKDYLIPGTNQVIPKGSQVQVSINMIHHDSRYYSEPGKFNPENFTVENKNKRHPYAFMPFGQGPRNCIAMRFAMIEAKAALAHLVYNFKIEPCEKTPIPVKVDKKSGIKKPDGGMWLQFSTREK